MSFFKISTARISSMRVLCCAVQKKIILILKPSYCVRMVKKLSLSHINTIKKSETFAPVNVFYFVPYSFGVIRDYFSSNSVVEIFTKKICAADFLRSQSRFFRKSQICVFQTLWGLRDKVGIPA